MAILLSNNCRAISPTAAVDRVTTRVGRIRRATSAGSSSSWAGPAVATPPTSSPNSVRKCPTTNRESPAAGVLGRRTSVKNVVNWTVSRFPSPDMGDTIKEFEQPRFIWICTQLKPPSRPFHEKIVNHVTNASLFEYVIFGVVLMAVIVCFVCGCYQCCCRQNLHDGRHSSRSFIEERNTDCSNFANHFGGQTKSNHVGSAGTNTERESLTNGGATQIGDGLIHPTPLSSSGKNGGPPLSFGRPPQHQSHTFAVGPNDQSAI
ncbi:hypothetical protein GPALN_005354 [Globodera pallida]|nr:hypothetical protein GPALN_005354 [Globodera pallida]